MYTNENILTAIVRYPRYNKFFLFSFVYSATKLWNSLSYDVVHASTVYTFRSQLKGYLFNYLFVFSLFFFIFHFLGISSLVQCLLRLCLDVSASNINIKKRPLIIIIHPIQIYNITVPSCTSLPQIFILYFEEELKIHIVYYRQQDTQPW